MHTQATVSNHNTFRREFIDRLALGTAAIGGFSLGLGAIPAELRAAMHAQPDGVAIIEREENSARPRRTSARWR